MKRATPPRAVVFDLDGTLLDSLSLVLEALRHALQPYGLQPTMDIFPLLGGPPERFLQTLVHDPKDVPVVMERLVEFHRVNGHLLRPFAGAQKLLENLHGRGIRLGLWTGRDRISADWLLRHHGLERFFSAIVCGDDLSTHKPDPEGLREILRRLGVNPADTLYVGDADVDVLGGASCGVDTLLIENGRSIEDAVAERCWRAVKLPQDAYEAVLGCLA